MDTSPPQDRHPQPAPTPTPSPTHQAAAQVSTHTHPTSAQEPSSVSVILSTAPDAETAAAIARPLVADGLAACVNIVPGVRSIYRWKGELCDDAEVLLILKTRTDRVSLLIEALKARHPYETPEILALPVTAGFPPYLQWVIDSVSA